MKTYTWLLFDADNTLFDFDKGEITALQHTFEQIGYPFEPSYLLEYRKINTQIWLDFEQGKITQKRLKTKRFELLSDALDIPYDSYEVGTQYLANLAKCTFLIDGAENLLQSLRKHFNIAVITNGLAKVQRPRLEQSAIYSYIQKIIISEEVGAAKPDRQIFDVAFEKMNQPAKHEVLLIGDSLTSDIQGGQNYGIDTCWFNSAQKPPHQTLTSTFEIQDLSELPGILA